MSEKGKGKPRLDNCAFVTQNSKKRKWEYLLIKAATRGVVCEKVFLEIKKKITGKHLFQSLFYNKVASLKHETLAHVFS